MTAVATLSPPIGAQTPAAGPATAPTTGHGAGPNVERSAGVAASIPLGGLVALLFALFTLDNVLLLGFLGQPAPLVFGLALIAPAIVALLTARVVPSGPRVTLPTLLACLAIALLLLVLGGEGRLLFATDDWQIRDAVLRDMGTHHWPFDYWLQGRSRMLRAPLGMYLLPALLGGASQAARDWALLAHNALVLGLLMAAGSALFADRRSRIVAGIIFIAFSGLDVLGTGLRVLLHAPANWDHLERWASGYQYSAHITQLFWVPQHAFAGWACALTYLLWRRGLASIGLFGATIPLVALWSPLAILGALPFALFGGLHVLARRTWGGRDVALCGLATIVALPALLYLQADAQAVRSGFRSPDPALYPLLLLLEVLPFLSLLLCERATRKDRPTLWIVGGCLVLMPLWGIGETSDFQMRASIMPLAILAISLADWALRLTQRGLKIVASLLISLGSVTGSAEIVRALRLAPSPPPLCSLVGIWTRQTGMVVPYASYFADRAALPGGLIPRGADLDRAALSDPASCWQRAWRTNRSLSS